MSDESEYSESGAPIYRHKPRAKPFTPALGDADNIEHIAKHIEQYIGPPDSVFHEIVSDLVHLDVHMVQPTAKRNYYTLVTSGMSERPMNVPEGMEENRYAELCVFLPPTWKLSQEDFEDERNYWPIRWLKQIARLPHEYDTWLGPGHTIPNGDPPEPFAANTKLCCMIAMPPFQVPKEFMKLELSDRIVHFYALCPLYIEEVNLKLKKGVEALLDQFDAKKIPPEIVQTINPARQNACKKRFGFF
jgi:hypothetical protein